MRGRETGKSLYTNYTWLPNLTIPMAKRIIEHCGIDPNDGVLDFGCSRGYLVRAFTELGWNAEGVDISEWAIKNADPAIKKCVRVGTSVVGDHDWIISKDVLEHIPTEELIHIIQDFGKARKGIFAVVPLSDNGSTYVVPEYDLDVTHVQRSSIHSWAGLFSSLLPGNGWEISMRYRIVGIKDNYAHFGRGNGFITCRRIG